MSGGLADIGLAGSIAYVAGAQPGLRAIDLTKPDDPRILGSVETPGRGSGVVVLGEYVYVTDRGPRVARALCAP
jgi:hypothetical protein